MGLRKRRIQRAVRALARAFRASRPLRTRFGCTVVALGVAGGAARAQTPAPLDGPGRPFQDSLFERLAGTWVMSGAAHGQPVTYSLRVEWVLNHQFLHLALRDTAQVPAYQASVFIGRDNLSERYVAHWLDVFGGRWSETLGYGTRAGPATEFLFEYPDGPFRTSFTLGRDGVWTVLMRQRTPAGEWQVFGQWALRRS